MLHRGLGTGVGKTDLPVGNLPGIILQSVAPALVQTGRPTLRAVQEQLLDVEDALWALQALPRQLIHRDAHIGNMLFRDTTFAGWVDFDLLETNFRIFDVCYCAAGLLAAQYTNSAWRTQWMSAVRTMVDAYGEVVRLVPAEVVAVWVAMIAIEALFVGISAQRDPQAAEGTAAICRWLFEPQNRRCVAGDRVSGTSWGVFLAARTRGVGCSPIGGYHGLLCPALTRDVAGSHGPTQPSVSSPHGAERLCLVK